METAARPKRIPVSKLNRIQREAAEHRADAEPASRLSLLQARRRGVRESEIDAVRLSIIGVEEETPRGITPPAPEE